MKIFWAWQSDTPGNVGRFFVRDALQDAINHLKSGAEIVEPTEKEMRDAMELDHDRKGVPGSPDLARTILDKIENAAVFVADVTPVGIVRLAGEGDEKKKDPKKLINSNVAIELGYSLRTRTDRSLLMVMNTHYGHRADLPFDVAHKGGPFMFELAPEADKKTIAAARAKLKAQLVEAINLCIADEVNEKKQAQPFELAPFAGPATFFKTNEILASTGSSAEQSFYFPHRRVAYMRTYPASGNVPVGRARIAKLFDEQKPCVMSMKVGGIARPNSYGSIIFDCAPGKTSINALTQGFKTGELWGVSGELFKSWPINSRATGKPESGTILPMVTFERVYSRVVRNYVDVELALGLSPPFTVVLGVVGLNDVYLTVPIGGPFNNGEFVGPIHEDNLQRTYTLAAVDDKSIKSILREFFKELYDMAYIDRADVWTDELLSAHDLPPR
jgi:hypothetical protein